jgi:superfamily II DNA or RNA helicase
VLTSNTPAKDRKRIVRDFKAGIIKVLFNYGVLSIGFDYPELEVVMVGRSSNSLSWIYQIFGRGVRVHENKKSFRFIDYGGNIQRFGKIEDLEIKLLPAAGYTVVNKDRVLTGVPLGTNYSVDQYVDLVRFGPKKEVLDFKIRFWFGKHKDKPLIQVPLHYLKWWAENSDEYTRSAKERELFNEIAKVLRMKVLVQ